MLFELTFNILAISQNSLLLDLTLVANCLELDLDILYECLHLALLLLDLTVLALLGLHIFIAV